jgi:phosphoserine aminotransferase
MKSYSSPFRGTGGMIHNFNAGPSILPKQVFEEASQAVLNYNDTGLSILEIGHRTPIFQNIMDEARALVKELMQLDNDREVLFLHGGASTQFMQVPMNLLNEKETAAFSDTGIWAAKAIKEAVYGTQWQDIPKVSIPMVADMSSDILSRQINFNLFDLIYAGAQKNIGAAGVNLVVINKNILGKVKRTIPTIMDYRNHIKEGSMLNTPPVFAVYVSMLTLRWLKNMGGVDAIEKLNNEKAALLYNEIDNNPMFTGTVAKEDRSKMNVCFVINDKDLEEQFLEFAKQQNIVGIKGHRAAGGFRASLYNALPLTGVQGLVDVMKEFANKFS